MKERDLFERVFEETLKRDEVEEKETLDKIKARVKSGEIEQAVRAKSRKITFYKRLTMVTVALVVIATAIITPVLLVVLLGKNGGGINDGIPHYSSSDLVQVDVGFDYDITGLYNGNTDISGFQKSGISIYQTDDEAPKVILLAIYYTGDDGLSSFFLNIVLVENLEYLHESNYDGLNKKLAISINDKNYEIDYRELFEPYDSDYPQILSVNQRTKFEIEKTTYYMQVDYMIIIEENEEPLNLLKEIVTQLF